MGLYDWLYKTSPVYSNYDEYPYPPQPPMTPLSIPGPAWLPEPDTGAMAVPPPPIDVSAPVEDLPAQRRPVEIGRETTRGRSNQKTVLGKALLDVLPRALQAGIAGAATPNIAGGGPTDFFRAMQAGQQSLDTRDANKLALQRQARSDADAQIAAQIAQETARQQQQMYGAHTNLYNAQAAAAKAKQPDYLEIYNRLLPVIGAEKAAIVASRGTLAHHAPGESPYKGLQEIDKEMADMLHIPVATDGKYYAHPSYVTRAITPLPPDPREQQPTAPHYFNRGGQVTAVDRDPKGQYGTTPIGQIADEPKVAAPKAPPAPTFRDEMTIKKDYDKAVTDANDAYNKEAKEIEKEANKGDSLAALRAARDPAKAAAAEAAKKAAIDKKLAGAAMVRDMKIVRAQKALDEAKAALRAAGAAASAAAAAQPPPAPATSGGKTKSSSRMAIK